MDKSELMLIPWYHSRNGSWHRFVDFGGKRKTGLFIISKGIAPTRVEAERIFRLFDYFVKIVGNFMHPKSLRQNVDAITIQDGDRPLTAERLSHKSILVH
ncbi:MAG: hypothetical protein JW816_01110 [Candidatus Buchananbacteria bacterium]|nr:hypothetical protein [Candidatus Buchananbacteria bacterium]